MKQKFSSLRLKNLKEHKIPQHIIDMTPIKRAIYTDIYKRRFVDQNYFCTTVGPTGTGKTTALLQMAWNLQVDPKTLERNFDVETQLGFTCEKFTNFVKNTDPTKDPGRVYIFDEIEIEANSKSWDVIGQVFALTVSTCRFKQNIILASLPLEQQLILHGRELRHSRITCKRIDWDNQVIETKFENLEYNPHSKDTYGSKFYSNAIAKGTFYRVFDEGIEFKLDPVYFKRPPLKIEKKYKQMKVEYLNKFYDENEKVLMQKSKKRNIPDALEVWEFIDKNKSDLKNDKGLVDPILVHTLMNIPITKAKEFCRSYNHRKIIKKLKRD